MKIVFNIEVGIDVRSYVEAGEILDRVTREVEAAIGPKGSATSAAFRRGTECARRDADDGGAERPGV